MGVDPQRDPGKLAQVIGVQLQSSGLPPSMNVDEAMKFFCAYHRVKPRQDLIERMGLGEKRRAVYSDLSIGQKRRLNLALAVAHNPPCRHPGRADRRLGCGFTGRAARHDERAAPGGDDDPARHA